MRIIRDEMGPYLPDKRDEAKAILTHLNAELAWAIFSNFRSSELMRFYYNWFGEEFLHDLFKEQVDEDWFEKSFIKEVRETCLDAMLEEPSFAYKILRACDEVKEKCE